MNKEKMTIGGVIIALVLGVIGLFGGNSTVIQNTPGVGAVASPDIPSNWIRVGGVAHYSYKLDMKAPTTTLCAIKNTSNATTTLDRVMVSINTGTSTAATIDVATSTTAFATTTNLITAHAVGVGNGATFGWTPVGGTVDDNLLAPNEYVIVKTAGSGLDGYTYVGNCKAEMTVYNF